MSKKMFRSVAEVCGYTIDDHCNPIMGYKGPRFAPFEWVYVYSPAEEVLLSVQQYLMEFEDDASRAWVRMIKGVMED